MLNELLLAALGAAALCLGKHAVHAAVRALFARLLPAERRRRRGWRVEVGEYEVKLIVRKKGRT